jgi:virulence-associated protein VagC
MKLNFKRRLSRSAENRAATITIPRSVAQAWKEYDSVDITFDGRCLVIVPYTEASEAGTQ